MSKSSRNRNPGRSNRRGRRTGGLGNTNSTRNDIHAIAAAVTATTPMSSIDKYQFPRADIFDDEVFNCFDTCEFQNTFSAGTGTNSFLAVAVSGASFNNFSDMSQAFDTYRIKGMEVWLYPNATASFSGQGGMLSTVIDVNDSITPGTIGQLLGYSNVVTTPTTSIQHRTFKPRTEGGISAVSTGTITAGTTLEDQWLDTSNGTAAQFGLKIGSTPPSVAISYNMVVRAHFQYKNVR